MKLKPLEALLIFLADSAGRSGYDIVQLFQTTPLGLFSDSPGAIYPALARLEGRQLLTSETELAGRRRRSYARTPAGTAALHAWLEDDAIQAAERRPELVELRFVMIAGTLGRDEAARFLRRRADFYAEELARLESFRAGPALAMPEASRAAIDLGIRLCRTRLEWCRETARAGETSQ
jgi:DNA-binding PadR family transcriptional regulator